MEFTQFTNCTVLRGGSIKEEDLWVLVNQFQLFVLHYSSFAIQLSLIVLVLTAFGMLFKFLTTVCKLQVCFYFLWCYNLENDWQQPHLVIVKDEQKVYDGKIVEHRGIGSQFPLPHTLRQINCGGLLLAPGLIDLQVQCAHCHKTSSIQFCSVSKYEKQIYVTL